MTVINQYPDILFVSGDFLVGYHNKLINTTNNSKEAVHVQCINQGAEQLVKHCLLVLYSIALIFIATVTKEVNTLATNIPNIIYLHLNIKQCSQSERDFHT